MIDPDHIAYAIEQQPLSRTKKKTLIKKVYKTFKQTNGEISWLYEQDPLWAYRICVAKMSQSIYEDWWGWECRSDWAWKMLQIGCIYPAWKGERDARLFVYGEQGLGDEIAFISAANELAEQCDDITWEVDDRLIPICERSIPRIKWVSRWGPDGPGVGRRADEWRGDFTHHITAANVPKLYRRSRADFPRRPYLTPDPEKRAKWEAYRGRYGISWMGGKESERKISPEDLIEGARPINLQYNATTDLADDLEYEDFDDHIALVSVLDHVNTVPTTLFHVCGAIGVPANVVKTPDAVESNTLRWEFNWGKRRSDWYGCLTPYLYEEWKHEVRKKDRRQDLQGGQADRAEAEVRQGEEGFSSPQEAVA